MLTFICKCAVLWCAVEGAAVWTRSSCRVRCRGRGKGNGRDMGRGSGRGGGARATAGAGARAVAKTTHTHHTTPHHKAKHNYIYIRVVIYIRINININIHTHVKISMGIDTCINMILLCMLCPVVSELCCAELEYGAGARAGVGATQHTAPHSTTPQRATQYYP
jgi:hypothetical protein